MTELKACPFCGGKATINVFRNGAEFLVQRTECLNCSCSLAASTEREDVIKHWNTRSKSPRYEKLLAFVKEQSKLEYNSHERLSSIGPLCSIGEDAKELLKEIGECP